MYNGSVIVILNQLLEIFTKSLAGNECGKKPCLGKLDVDFIAIVNCDMVGR